MERLTRSNYRRSVVRRAARVSKRSATAPSRSRLVSRGRCWRPGGNREEAKRQYVERTYQLQAAAFQPLVSVTSVGELKAIAAGGSWAQGKMDRMKDLLDRLVQVSISETEVLDAYVVAVNSRSPGLTIPDRKSVV